MADFDDMTKGFENILKKFDKTIDAVINKIGVTSDGTSAKLTTSEGTRDKLATILSSLDVRARTMNVSEQAEDANQIVKMAESLYSNLSRTEEYRQASESERLKMESELQGFVSAAKEHAERCSEVVKAIEKENREISNAAIDRLAELQNNDPLADIVNQLSRESEERQNQLKSIQDSLKKAYEEEIRLNKERAEAVAKGEDTSDIDEAISKLGNKIKVKESALKETQQEIEQKYTNLEVNKQSLLLAESLEQVSKALVESEIDLEAKNDAYDSKREEMKAKDDVGYYEDDEGFEEYKQDRKTLKGLKQSRDAAKQNNSDLIQQKNAILEQQWNIEKQQKQATNKKMADDLSAAKDLRATLLAQGVSEDDERVKKAQEQIDSLQPQVDKNNAEQLAIQRIAEERALKQDPTAVVMGKIRQSTKESKAKADELTGTANSLQERADTKQAELEAKEKSGEDISDDDRKELEKLQEEAAKAQNEAAKAQIEAFEDGLLENAVNKMVEGVTSSIDRAIDLLNQYEASSEARLQGSDTSYRKIMSKTTSLLSLSPFVKSEKMLENVNKLLEEGVTYNLELRAFLETVSDKVVATFDATDGTLRRLIRLQQADTTAARMGMQAGLTRFLNSMYQDSSYMKETYSQIAAAIMDTNSQLSRNQAISFESTVQAWIGAMHSVGLSDKGATTIAEGLNYLGSGNVSALAGNESLQTLMAISAEKAGLSYADILTDGLDAGKTNQLLTAMVNYLSEIAEGDNMVVKSEYGRILGLDIADLKAISSIKGDVGALAGQTKSYGGAMGELALQFAQLPGRVTISEMMTNIMDNFTFNMGRSIASNPVTFGMYKALNLINEGTDGNGIAIPAVSVMGNSFDFNQTVDGLLKSGLVGFSVLSGAMGAISSLGNLGGLNLSAWGGSDYVSRGGGGGIAGSMSTSNTTYVGNQNSSDSRDAALMGGKEEGEEMNEVTNPDQDKELTFTDWYKKVGPDGNGGDYISVRLEKTFDDLLEKNLPLIQVQSMYLKNIYDLMNDGAGVKVRESDNGNPLQNLADTISNQQQDSATQATNIVQQLLFALNSNPAGIPINIRTVGSSNISLGQVNGWPVVPIVEV